MKVNPFNIILSILCLFAGVFAVIYYCHSSTPNADKTVKDYLDILAKVNLLYVPTFDDCSLYFDPETEIQKPYRDAIYQNFRDHYQEI